MVALGIVSFFTDVSSEMIIPVLPLFVTGTLHASVARLGLIEGVAESTASLLRIASGWLSDRIGRRKPFLVFGYGLSGLAKASMALASSWPAVLGLRFADRLGKGLRNPPRDAMIADSVPREHLGKAFGFHRGLDSAGAALGPLVAFAMLSGYPGELRRIFLLSAAPALLALLVLVVFVRAPHRAAPTAAPAMPRDRPRFGAPFKRFLFVAGLFSLGNSSTAFLLLLASRVGFRPEQVPLLYLLYNLVYALLSWPIGALSDRIGRRRILLAAYLLFAGLYGLLAWRSTPVILIGAFALLGVHSALLEGSQRSMISDLAPAALRATAYGIYYTVVGLALLPASLVAGWLWARFETPSVMFGADALLALMAAVAFAVLLPAHREHGERHALPA